MVPLPGATGGQRIPGTVLRQAHSGMTIVRLDTPARDLPYGRSQIEALPKAIDPRAFLARLDANGCPDCGNTDGDCRCSTGA